MKPHNSYGKGSYILLQFALTIMFFYVYLGTMFVCALGTQDESIMLLNCLVLTSLVIGIIVTFCRYRNTLSLLVTMLLPFEIYTIFAFCDVFPNTVAFIIALILICSARFCFEVMRHPIANAHNHRRIVRRRLQYCVVAGRTIAAGCMLLLSGVLFARATMGGYLIKSSVEPVIGNVEENDCTIGNNIDTLSLLKEEEWGNLSVQERLSVLQTVANIEARYLGLPHELEVSIAAMEEYTEGEYDHINHVIHISMDNIKEESSSYSLDTVCHEAYHAYQRELVERYGDTAEGDSQLLFLKQVAQYEYEFEHYIDGNEDEAFIDYYFQDVERDAREYALSAVADYYDNIGEPVW